MAGSLMIAAQTLEKRTGELRQETNLLQETVETFKAENTELWIKGRKGTVGHSLGHCPLRLWGEVRPARLPRTVFLALNALIVSGHALDRLVGVRELTVEMETEIVFNSLSTVAFRQKIRNSH